MIKRLIVPLTLVILLLSGCIPTAQDSPQTFPPDVVAEVQTTLDDLTAGELPPGMVVGSMPEVPIRRRKWSANLADNTPMPPEGVPDWQHHQDVHRGSDRQTCGGRRADPGRSAGAPAAGGSRSTAEWRPDHTAPPAHAHLRSV